MRDLWAALRIIHADREWWRKALMGGALWLSLVGWPIVEGYQLESIENSQRGFPTPLPRWYAFADKMVVGIFALLIDFFFFVFPILLLGMLFFCGTLTIGLSGNDSAARAGVFVGLSLIGLCLLMAWLSGASAVGKQRYVANGDMQDLLSVGLVRELLRGPDRGLYMKARLSSLPPYLLALTLLLGGVVMIESSRIAALVVLWIGLSTLLWARLVAIQLYLKATRQIERLRFDRLAARGETYGRGRS